MFIVLINDRLLRCKYTNFSCLQMECRYFFLFNHQAVDIFARNEKLLNVLISSIDRFFRSISRISVIRLFAWG